MGGRPARRAITSIPFVSPLSLGIEVMPLDRVWTAAPPGLLARPLRADFSSMLFVTAGETTLTVDFDEHRLGPRSAIWVRPGQVQQFGGRPARGDLVLFRDDFLIAGTRAATIADDRFAQVTGDGRTPVSASVDRLRRTLRDEYAAIRDRSASRTQVETLRHLLCALILSLDSSPDAPADRDGLDRRFRHLLERDFAAARDVGHYARRLGYSQRALTRATQSATGESPKQAIDRRVALEARRLLAHTEQPIASIARQLGFSDASNFATFFAHHVHQTPSGFRRLHSP